MNGPLLVFDLVGPMAHFRKFYTNSSSLSYPFPPRTTLMGIIAALLGWERDSYYEELGSDRARIGVAIKAPVRSVMQTVNYLATDDGDWHGVKRRTQIPLELILPRPPARLLRYRVFFSHEEEALVRTLYEQLQAEHYAYPLCFGITECPAWVENVHLYDEVKWQDGSSAVLPVGAVVPLPRVELPPPEELVGLRLLKDRVPLDFHPDRKLKAVTSVLWEAGGKPLPLKVQGTVFSIPGEGVFGVFLEV